MKRTLLFFGLFVLCSVPVYALYHRTGQALLFGNIAQLAGLLFIFTSYVRLAGSFPRRHPSRIASQQFAFGAFIWILGQCLEMYCELILHLNAYGTISDAFWTLGYIPMFIALYAIFKEIKAERNIYGWKYFLPIIPLAVVAYALVFYLLILPQLHEANQPVAETILDFLYPTLDLLLVVLCAAIAIMARPRSAFFVFSILTASGVILTMVGDGVLSLVTNFHSAAYLSVDVFYFISYFTMALAADYEWQRRLKTPALL